MRSGDNSRKVKFLKHELNRVIENKLTPLQRDYIVKHYWLGMRNSDIARESGVGCPQVSKGISSAQKTIRNHLEDFLDLYDRLERDIMDGI